MNTYKISFLFGGKFHYINITANQIANHVVNQNVDISGSMYEYDDGERNLYEKFYVGGKTYIATLSLYNSNCVNVYEYIKYEDGEESDILVEENIPYMLLQIVSSNGDVVYNITDNI